MIAGGQPFSSSVSPTGRVLTMTGPKARVMWGRIGVTVAAVVGGATLVTFYDLWVWERRWPRRPGWSW